MWIAIGIIVAVVVLIFLWLAATYNRLVTLRNRVRNAWSQIDVQLQRRNDLIPNLVNTVKGYASHEKETLAQVTNARAAMAQANDPTAKINAADQMGAALKSLFAVAEAYPELKADQNFRELQLELSDTEDKISYMRQSYNDTVMKYNTAIQKFPTVLVAGMFGFAEEKSFGAAPGADSVPNVSF